MVKLVCNDIGFWQGKVLWNNTLAVYKSIVGVGKQLQLEDLNLSNTQDKDHIICRTDDSIYFISDLAIDECETILYSLRPDRFDSEVTKILIKVAYAMTLGSGTHEVYVVSGLPLDHYNRFKKDIVKLFQADGETIQDYDVSINGKEVFGKVRGLDSRFIPQPFGVLADIILDDRGEIYDREKCSRTIAIVDIGFGTTDVYVANSLSPIERLSFSTPIAMNHAYTLIANKIKETCEVDVPIYKIDSIVNSGRFFKDGKTYNMKPIIDWSMKVTANQLISELSTRWKNTHEIDEICLSGGGGIRLQSFILPEFDNATLAQDGQLAVVKGYQKWGRRVWKGVI